MFLPYRFPLFLAFLTLCLLFIPGCSPDRFLEKPEALTTPAYVAGIDEWHKTREAQLKAHDGWLTLAGLYWLTDGENTFGSGAGNSLTFPEGKIADRAGTITLANGQVTTRIARGVEVTSKGLPITEAVLFSPELDSLPTLSHGSLTWFVIRRGDKYGIRLRDQQNSALLHFKGIKRYPVEAAWRIDARFEPHKQPKQIPITNIVGQTTLYDSPGSVLFNWDGKTYRLDAFTEANKLFLIFADQTNGHETYGAGRYLYAPMPDASGNTVLDFNQSINPPCDFVSYATCPLPPRQNFLPIEITAGEKSYGEY